MTIASSISSLPYTTCEKANIYPIRKGEFGGILHVRERAFEISITELSHNGNTHVLARVILFDEIPEKNIEKLAYAVAFQQKTNAAFDPVYVKVIDGATAYLKAWTVSKPSDEEIDAFLTEAEAFIDNEFASLQELSELGEANFANANDWIDFN